MNLKNLIIQSDNTITHSASLIDAFTQMQKESLTCLVLIKKGKPFGVVTSKDMLDMLNLSGKINIQTANICDKHFVSIKESQSLDYAYNIVSSFDMPYLILTDDEDNYIGLIKKETVIAHIKKIEGCNNKDIKQIDLKPSEFIDKEHTIKQIVDIFEQEKINSFLIREDEEVLGIISMQNILQYADFSKNLDITLDESTYIKPYVINLGDSIDNVLDIMLKNNLQNIVIYERRKKEYFTLNIQEALQALKTTREYFLNLKIDANHTILDGVKNAIFEIYKINNDYVISWLNSYAKEKYKLEISLEVNHFFSNDTWQNIYKKIENNEKIEDLKILIQNEYKRVKISYATYGDTVVLKFLILDTHEDRIELNKKEKDLSSISKGKLFNDIYYQESFAIGYISEDFTLLDINPSGERLLGYKKNELLGENIFNTIYHESQIEAKKAHNDIKNAQKPYSVVLERFKKKNDEIVWIQLTINRILKEDDTTKYYTVFMEDFTSYCEDDILYKKQKDIFSAIVDESENMIAFKDENLKYQTCNTAMLNFFKLDLYSVIGKNDFEIFPSDLSEFFIQIDKEVMRKRAKIDYTISVLKNDDFADVHVSARPIYDLHSTFKGVVTTMQDLSVDEENSTDVQKIIRNTFANSNESIIITDDNVNIVAVNSEFLESTGYSEKELLGKKPSVFSNKKNSKSFYEKMWNSIKRSGRWRGEIRNRRKNGEICTEFLSISTIKDKDGRIIGYMGIFIDATLFSQQKKELNFIAYHDSLTKLPNRMSFEYSLKDMINRSQRGGYRTGVLFFDLDHFKEINDTFGHSVGDKVLVQVAHRLKKTLRQSDIVSRIGGDEFIVLIEDFNERKSLLDVVEKIFDIFKYPFMIDKRMFNITTSIGSSVFPDDGENMEMLVKNADAAMYQAKQTGRNTHCQYTSDITNALFERVETVSDIRNGIKKDQFFLHYQPQIDINTNQIIGVEALARWKHPTKGIVYPEAFISVAEKNRLIIPIGRRLIRKVCEDIKRWIELDYNMENFTVAINVSAIQLTQDDIYEVISQVCSKVGINAKYLKIELTETSVMSNPEKAITLFEKLQDLGVTLSIDDFGTGYSSLGYLKRFSVNQIKIDKSFIMDIPYDKDDIAITKAVLALGKSMGIEVLAEGVEDKAQKDFLLAQGCFKAQGYLYAPPLETKKLEEMFLECM